MKRRKDNIFTKVFLPKVPQSRFDLSHGVKTSFSMGELIPTLCKEVLPGDVWRIKTQNMMRFAPLIAPVMHRVRVKTRYFFVPNRLLWENWEDFITQEGDNVAPFVALNPNTDTDRFPVGSVADYLGYPTDPVDAGLVGDVRVSPMKLAAYSRIWDDWFRDQNLQNERFEPLVDGDNATNYAPNSDVYAQPFRVNWMHDYFTSCLPFAQKGDAVTVPLTVQDNIPVTLREVGSGFEPMSLFDLDATPATTGDLTGSAGPTPYANTLHSGGTADANAAVLDPSGNYVVDVQADAVEIEQLRLAFKIQKFLERTARTGSRYVEKIWGHFQTRSSDARLQRAEYLGGHEAPMVISEVLSTAQSDTASVPVGQMAGHGISFGDGYIEYHAEEHGHIFALTYVVPDTAYQQGVHREFTRFDPLDYAWPDFAHLGEQPVLNKEVLISHTTPEGVFGYIPRYSEYKFDTDKVSGEFKTTLAFWHLGRIFDGNPALNSAFVACVPRTDIFAVTGDDEDHIFAHIYHEINAVRKLPRHAIPSI